jgi:hypothetical protein
MAACVALLALVLQPVLHQSVFVCPGGDDGAPLFTDRPCPEGIERRLDAANVVAGAPLTPAEQATLDALGRRPATAASQSRRGARPPADDGAECEAVAAALADLRAMRRRGYRVGESAALDARERELRARRESCP